MRTIKQIRKKRSSIKRTHYFDACTHLIYKDREMELLNQLCRGNPEFTQTILKKELHFFLKHDESLHQSAKALTDIDELCHYLRTSVKHKGLFQRMFQAFSESTTLMYHLFLQSLNAEHYLATMIYQMRMNNFNAMFQYIYFQFPSKVKTQTALRDFTRFLKHIYGEEFYYVLCIDELNAIRLRYVEHLKQITFMLNNKGFAFDDMFTERNPSYLFHKQINRDVLMILKTKLKQIVDNCSFLQKHIRSSKSFSKQSKQYRELQEKRRQEMLAQQARDNKIKALQDRNAIEYEKMTQQNHNMQMRNNIEYQKLVLKQKQ